MPQIEVTFDIDANGILSVTAKDKATNKQQSITITGASTLAKDEVERMVKDAEANAAADKEKSEQIDVKNQSDALIYQTGKQLEELGDKVPAEEKTKITDLIAKLEEAVKAGDYSSMKDLNESIKNLMMEVGQKVYSQNPNPAGNTSSTPGDDAIETDFSTEK